MIDFLHSISNVVGLIGVALLLFAFFLLNTSKVSPLSLIYQWFNFIGAGFILFSLLFQWNLSAAVIEIAWMLISIVGIVRSYKHSLKNKPLNT